MVHIQADRPAFSQQYYLPTLHATLILNNAAREPGPMPGNCRAVFRPFL